MNQVARYPVQPRQRDRLIDAIRGAARESQGEHLTGEVVRGVGSQASREVAMDGAEMTVEDLGERLRLAQ
nr:hypothetical protein [Nonomuraea rhodomycinica]